MTGKAVGSRVDAARGGTRHLTHYKLIYWFWLTGIRIYTYTKERIGGRAAYTFFAYTTHSIF